MTNPTDVNYSEFYYNTEVLNLKFAWVLEEVDKKVLKTFGQMVVRVQVPLQVQNGWSLSVLENASGFRENSMFNSYNDRKYAPVAQLNRAIHF
jgi:hypothetical protein